MPSRLTRLSVVEMARCLTENLTESRTVYVDPVGSLFSFEDRGNGKVRAHYIDTGCYCEAGEDRVRGALERAASAAIGIRFVLSVFDTSDAAPEA